MPPNEDAVEIPRLVLLHGRDPLFRKPDEEIIASPQAKILSMQKRLEMLKSGSDPKPGGIPAPGGSRGSAGGGPGPR